MTSGRHSTPDWDLEQVEVILDDPDSWQFVEAGPGAGKSAVACQRVAFLVDEGIPPSRILLISFTRTAVAELRERIVSYAMAGERARSARISTIDSHAWTLRAGFEDDTLPKSFGDRSYDMSISQAVELFRSQQTDLLEFMAGVEHFIVDEAQDVMGVRADLVIEMLRSLSPDCGVTILADPAQAIYGFTSDEQETGNEAQSLIQRLETESPRPLERRQLKQIHRIRNQQLLNVFHRTRHEVDQRTGDEQYVSRVISAIRDNALEDIGAASPKAIAKHIASLDGEARLVLFRRRADVLMVSSYCSNLEVQHRLRMSGLPLVVRPWLGWLLAEFDKPLITAQEFQALWSQRISISPAPFEGECEESAWGTLRHLAAAGRPDAVNLVHLRSLMSRSRPPVELCLPEVGVTGSILGTIHASKGREADTVELVLPPDGALGRDVSLDAALEEGHVYYVGATRARESLVTAQHRGSAASQLDSGRVYRHPRPVRGGLPRVQLEIGRGGDVDSLQHLAWTTGVQIQRILAQCAGKTLPLEVVSSREHKYEPRLRVAGSELDGVAEGTEIGRLSDSFRADLNKIWLMVDTNRRRFRPPGLIRHVYLVGVTSVALSDSERKSAGLPFSASGFALAPIVKGFPLVQFMYQYGKR